MATIPKNIKYTIQILDGSELFLTSTTIDQPITLEPQSDEETQIWRLTDENQLLSNNLFLDGNEIPCKNKDNGRSENYVVMDGDDAKGYNIEWWALSPVPDGTKIGYLFKSGDNTKISASTQKWKFTKVVSRDPAK